jgi:apolipoprotein N-acyltransferase
VKSLAYRLVQTSVGAVIASLAYPQPGIGVLMFVGLPMMVFAFRGQSLGRGALIGFVTGFVYYGAVAKWLTIYLGVVPWLGLVGAQAVIFTGGGFSSLQRGKLRIRSTFTRFAARCPPDSSSQQRGSLARQSPRNGRGADLHGHA